RVVPTTEPGRFPTVHGPQVALLFAPIARLPYVPALYVWLAITFVGYLNCGYAVWRVCPRLRASPWTVGALMVASPALQFDLSFAQTSVIALACVTAGYLALLARRPLLAGLAI